LSVVILGINTSHNASATLTIDNEIIFHLEAERLTDDKHSHFPHEAVRVVKDYVDHVDAIALSGLKTASWWDNMGETTNQYIDLVRSLGKSFTKNKMQFFDYGDAHHLCHAATAFYNSGFDEALCIVKDGAGSFVGNRREQESNFLMSKGGYPTLVDRVLSGNRVGLAESYEIVSQKLGFTEHDAGKVMGLSSYGDTIVSGYLPDGHWCRRHDCEICRATLDIKEFEEAANIAYSLQRSTEDAVIEDVHRLIAKTGKRNICVSGGLFLNCVMNYKLLSSLPDDVNLYVEPLANDSGNSVGAARLAYFYEFNGDNHVKQETLFYGPKREISLREASMAGGEVADSQIIAKLISERNVVAMFQGGSESGPRALGNRTIMYDPRDPDGKDRVNKVKGREWFRPFAGSVLHEYASQWFDMKSLSESPYMMFAVNVIEDKKSLIPSITHVDGTCRIQTVKRNNNTHFYDVINDFHKITGVPVVFNTSFNLAGHCLIETVDDALKTFRSSDIDILYFPEVGRMMRKNNE
jgi:carbamoyltransferase